MMEDLFCPKRGRLLKKTLHGHICPECGLEKPAEINLIAFLQNLLRAEIEEEKKNVRRDFVNGVVVDVSNEIATIECENYPKFEEGDPVGVILGDEIFPFGTVIMPGKELTVKLETHVNEGQKLKLCDAEILIGYELQLEVLDKIEKEFEYLKKIMFESFEFPEIKKVKVEKPLLDASQKEVVESILALDDGELLLVIGPPGTGKTTVICEAVKDLAKSEKILITSHTNRAVDNAIEKLGDDFLEITVRIGRPEKVHPNIQKFLLSYKARTALGDWLEQINRRISELKQALKIAYKYYRDFKIIPDFKTKIRKIKSELKRII